MLKYTKQLFFFFCMCFHRQSIQVSRSSAGHRSAGCSEIMWTGPLFRCDTVPRMLVCIMGEAAWCFWCCGRSSALGCLKCLSCVHISYDSQDHFTISRMVFTQRQHELEAFSPHAFPLDVVSVHFLISPSPNEKSIQESIRRSPFCPMPSNESVLLTTAR